jgi:ribose transport system substrate-binding protein
MRNGSLNEIVRRIWAVGASTLVLALVAACGDKGGSGAARGDTTSVARGGAGKTVGVVLPSRGTEFWQQFASGLEEAAERGDYKLRIESAEMDTSRQRTAIERLTTEKVDALLVAPIDPASASTAIARAAESKVPVFTAGQQVPGARVVSHVASDDAAGGEVAATYISTFMRGRGEVAILGFPGRSADDAREQSFRRAMSAQKGMPIVGSASGGGTRESARAATEALLEANPQIDALFVTDEAQTLGALDATRGRWQELVIVGYGLSADAEAAITEETPLKAVVLEAPREMGIRALQVAAEHLSNEGVPARLAVGVKLISAGNVPSRSAAK